MPVQFNLPPLLLLGPLLAAVVVYVVLRWVVWPPRTGTTPASVSEHALWVGVIGWLASSLQGAMNVGIIPADPSAGGALTSAETIAPALMWPVLGCLTVHALGQITYPGPRRMRRQAVLSVRRIRDFLPRRLALDHGRHLPHRRRGHRPDGHPPRIRGRGAHHGPRRAQQLQLLQRRR